MSDRIETLPAICGTRGELMERAAQYPAPLHIATRVITVTEACNEQGQVVLRYQHTLPRK